MTVLQIVEIPRTEPPKDDDELSDFQIFSLRHAGVEIGHLSFSRRRASGFMSMYWELGVPIETTGHVSVNLKQLEGK